MSQDTATSSTTSSQRPRDWLESGKHVLAEVRNDKVPIVAAGLAFFAMLAIFPAIIAFVSIYGLVAEPSQIQAQITALTDNLPSNAAGLIEDQLTNFVSLSATTLRWTSILAVVGAIWSASSGTHQLVKAINIAYDTEEKRGFLRVRGIALLLTLGFFLLAGLSLALIVVIPPLLSALDLATGTEWVISVGRFLLLALVVIVSLSVVYRYAPYREKQEWEWASLGAVIATVLWIVASILFTIFVSMRGSFNATHGSIAGVIVMMLWFYISGFIVLLGAEINGELERQLEGAGRG